MWFILRLALRHSMVHLSNVTRVTDTRKTIQTLLQLCCLILSKAASIMLTYTSQGYLLPKAASIMLIYTSQEYLFSKAASIMLMYTSQEYLFSKAYTSQEYLLTRAASIMQTDTSQEYLFSKAASIMPIYTSQEYLLRNGCFNYADLYFSGIFAFKGGFNYADIFLRKSKITDKLKCSSFHLSCKLNK